MKKKWVLRHCDLDLWPKVINFNRVQASAGSSHLAKTASKSVHPFGWNFVHKQTSDTHTDTQTDKQQCKKTQLYLQSFAHSVKHWTISRISKYSDKSSQMSCHIPLPVCSFPLYTGINSIRASLIWVPAIYLHFLLRIVSLWLTI